MLDIVIVNWNAGQLLYECVNSIFNSSFTFFRIVVIDNASKDQSISLLPVNEKIVIVQNTKNIGFAAACNQGLNMCNGEYVLFLNPDTRLFPDTLERSIKYMMENPEISVMGCKQLDEKGNIMHSCSRFPSFKTALNDIFGLSKLFPKKFPPSTIMRDWDHQSSRNVDEVMGSFFLTKRNILKQFNGFDEQFFVYYEELDLCKRISTKGGEIFYNSEIEIFHTGCGTTNQIKATRLYYSLNSKLKYYKKHFKFKHYVILKIMIYTIEPIMRIFQNLLSLNFKSIIETLNGYYYLIKNK